MSDSLLALIEEDPDDLNHYLILSDWLMSKNDPRGLLISLQYELHQTPEKPKLKRSIKQHLQTHHKVLLGALHDRSELKLEWKWGFIRSAALEPLPLKETLYWLGELLAHESSRPLERLHVRASPQHPVDVDAIGALLLQHKRPRLLRELHLGTPKDFDLNTPLGARLLSAFPRLGQPAAERWQEVQTRIAKQRRLKIPFPLDSLKVPKSKDGPLKLDLKDLMQGLKAELGRGSPSGVIAALKSSCESAALDSFSRDLGALWKRHKMPSAERWVLDLIGLLGREQCAAFLGESLKDWSHQRGKQAVEQLTRIGVDWAVFELFAATLYEDIFPSVRNTSQDALLNIAKRRDISKDALIDRAAPRVAPSKQALDRLQYVQLRRLHQLMLDGVRYRAREFLQYFVFHPQRKGMVERLVWATFQGSSVSVPFTVNAQGRPVDIDGRSFEISDPATVGLLHPAELEPNFRKDWREALSARGVDPLFLQLDRPVFAAKPDEKPEQGDRFTGNPEIHLRLDEAGWLSDYENIDFDEEFPTYFYWKYFPRDSIRCEACIAFEGARVSALRFFKGPERKKLDGDRVHRVTLSEILYDLEYADGKHSEHDRQDILHWTP